MLDLYGGHAVAALGYGHPRWIEALERAGARAVFQSNAVPLEVRARAADAAGALRRRSASTRSFFVNTGAEANENALKLALQITGRRKVVAVEGSFHGRTAAAGAVTWGARRSGTASRGRRSTSSSCRARDARGDRAHRRRETRRRSSSSPCRASAARSTSAREFLQALRARCDETGALLIFDEVQCGMGRTGYPFAANLYGVTPDMITTAKALGAGFPCAALLMSARRRARSSSPTTSARRSAAARWPAR